MIGPNGQHVQSKSLWDQCEGARELVSVSWSHVDAEALIGALVALTDSGSAVTLGLTSDGGALMIAVLDNGKVSKSYFHDLTLLEDRLKAVKNMA